MTAGLALAVLIGLSLGLLGGGGSTLTVPILVYVVGLETKPAIAASLVVVGSASLFGAFGHWRAGNVNVRVALVFGAFAMVGALIGSAVLAPRVSGPLQLQIFAAVMLVAAASMLRGRRVPVREGAGSSASLPLTVGVGIGVGVLTGLVGVGGGFLIVPALVLLAGLPMKTAVGTSLVVIAMNSVAGFAGYATRVEIPWLFLGLFTAVAVTGIFIGTWLVRFVSQDQLRRAFAVFLLVMGSAILWQNRASLTPSGPAAAGRSDPPGEVSGTTHEIDGNERGTIR